MDEEVAQLFLNQLNWFLFEKGMVDIDNVLKWFLFLIKLLVGLFINIFQFSSSPDLNNLVKT